MRWWIAGLAVGGFAATLIWLSTLWRRYPEATVAEVAGIPTAEDWFASLPWIDPYHPYGPTIPRSPERDAAVVEQLDTLGIRFGGTVRSRRSQDVLPEA